MNERVIQEYPFKAIGHWLLACRVAGGTCMNTCLRHIENWPELARQANWSVVALAKECGVSVRTLHRFFCKQMGESTKAWLAEQRQRQAFELLRDGCSIKQTASTLGYKQPTNFARQYKHHWGTCPTRRSFALNPAQAENVRK